MGTQKLSKEEYAITLCNKFSKALLTNLEAHYDVERLDPQVRKLVLDAFNDLAREQSKVLVDK